MQRYLFILLVWLSFVLILVRNFINIFVYFGRCLLRRLFLVPIQPNSGNGRDIIELVMLSRNYFFPLFSLLYMNPRQNSQLDYGTFVLTFVLIWNYHIRDSFFLVTQIVYSDSLVGFEFVEKNSSSINRLVSTQTQPPKNLKFLIMLKHLVLLHSFLQWITIVSFWYVNELNDKWLISVFFLCQ